MLATDCEHCRSHYNMFVYTVMMKMHWARKDIAMLPAIPLPLSAAQDDRDLLCWILPDFTDYDGWDTDDL